MNLFGSSYDYLLDACVLIPGVNVNWFISARDVLIVFHLNSQWFCDSTDAKLCKAMEQARLLYLYVQWCIDFKITGCVICNVLLVVGIVLAHRSLSEQGIREI